MRFHQAGRSSQEGRGREWAWARESGETVMKKAVRYSKRELEKVGEM